MNTYIHQFLCSIYSHMELVYLLLIWFFAKWRVLENSEKSGVFKIFLRDRSIGGTRFTFLPGRKTNTPLNSGEKIMCPPKLREKNYTPLWIWYPPTHFHWTGLIPWGGWQFSIIKNIHIFINLLSLIFHQINPLSRIFNQSTYPLSLIFTKCITYALF